VVEEEPPRLREFVSLHVEFMEEFRVVGDVEEWTEPSSIMEVSSGQ